MEKNYINNIIANKAALIEEFLKKTFLGIFNVKGMTSDYEMQKERKLSKKFEYDFTKDIKAAIERGKKFEYDFTKDIKSAIEREKNKKNLIK